MKKTVFALLLLCAMVLAGAEYKLAFSSSKKDAIYNVGEDILLSAQLLKDGKAATGCLITYSLHREGQVISSGKHTVSETPLTVSTKLDKPGWTHIYCKSFDENGNVLRIKTVFRGKPVVRNLEGGIGAMVEPHKIDISIKEPADFDAFWGNIKKSVLAHPLKVLEKVDVTPAKQKKNFSVYDVKVSCIGDQPVSGYLVIPKGGKDAKFPALVTFHGAGFRSSAMQFGYAGKGLIAFDVNAHGVPNGQAPAFYQNYRTQLNKKLGGRYNHSGKEDRDKYFYKNVYMRVIRALQYVKSLPEWDGKNLFIVGGSQGGAQAIVACALDHDVTMARALVPALCDHSGNLTGRQSGWPRVYSGVNGKPESEKALQTMAYYDNVFFARRIKCPLYTCTGFIDKVCSPTSVYAFYNNLPENIVKSMTITPTAPHTAGEKYFSNALDKYLKKIKKENKR